MNTLDLVKQDNKNINKVFRKKVMCQKCFHLNVVIMNMNMTIASPNKSIDIIDPDGMYYSFKGVCHECNHNDEMIILDYDIADEVSKLNQLGFKTLFCCEGHENSEYAYILFDENVDKRIFDTLPSSWKLEEEVIMAREVDDTLEEYTSYKIVSNYNIKERLDDLTEWVDQLEKEW